MPFDVENAAGSSDTYCLKDESYTKAKILYYNHLFRNTPYSSLVPALPSGRPNPSSERTDSTFGNVLSPIRGEKWICAGYYAITRATTSGYEMAGASGNYNLRIRDTTGAVTDNLDCTNPAASTTTHYRDPRDLAFVIQTRLRASGTLPSPSGYYCVFNDERQTTSPTYKFEIGHTTRTIEILVTADASSIGPSIGFYTNRSGTTAYSSDFPPNHTEEYVVLDINDRSIYVQDSAVCTRYRYLVLVDDNQITATPDAVKANTVKIYFGNTLASVDETADSTFTSNRDIFTALGNISTYEGTDSGIFIGEPMGNASGWPARIHVIDLANIRYYTQSGSNKYAPDYRYMKIKWVNRGNPDGYKTLGAMFVGPGFYPARNMQSGHVANTEDPSIYGNQSGYLSRQFLEPYRVMEMNFDEHNPMSDNDYMVFESMIRGRRSEQTFGTSLSASPTFHNVNTNKGLTIGARPILVMDPLYAPSGASSKSILARGTYFGKLSMALKHGFMNYYHGQIKIQEDPL